LLLQPESNRFEPFFFDGLDMAWAKHAAGSELTLEQITDELLNGRDLSKKGNRKRQVEYAERTARKAIEQIGTSGVSIEVLRAR